MHPSIFGSTNSGPTYPSYTLKRNRSSEDDFAPLPNLRGDLILQVFTHKSMRRPGVSPDEYNDNERLVDLGKSAFEASFSRYFFYKRPMLKAYEIAERSRELLEGGLIQKWVGHYQLTKRLCCAPAVYPTLASAQEMCSVFYAYTGGHFLSAGPEAVYTWIASLLAREDIGTEPAVKTDPYQAISIPPPQKRAKSETMSPPPHTSPIFFGSQPPPPLPPLPWATVRAPKQPPPTIPTRPNPLSPAQPHAAFLPLFNEAAMKRRVTVEYTADFQGPPHAGQWTVNCIVNGISKGEGSSSHKQTAKEEAARNAYYSMGWQ